MKDTSVDHARIARLVFALPGKIRPLTWRRAEKVFLAHYHELREEAARLGIPYGP